MYNRKKIATSFVWRVMERVGAQGITFLVSLILARMLDPQIYGTLALISIITTVLQIFVDSGFGTALIQKKDTDEVDFSTVFYFNVSFCILLYLLLYFLAPAISKFFNKGDITLYIRVLGLLLVVSGFKNVEIAYVSRNLEFKTFFFATLAGTVVAGICGVYMAYKGLGVWALITQNLLNQTIDTIILWFCIAWKPTFCFSFQRLKGLFRFGWKLLVTNLCTNIFAQIRQLCIGKKYTTGDLAFYNKGQEYPHEIALIISTSIDGVLLPVMSQSQDDRAKVREMLRRSIRISSFVIFPLMIGLIVCADSLIPILLGSKWIDSIFYFRICCFYYMFYSINMENVNALKATGKSNLVLQVVILKNIIGVVTLIITMLFSVKAIGYGILATTIFDILISVYPNRKIIGYYYGMLWRDILQPLAISTMMGILAYFIYYLKLTAFLTLIAQITFCGVFYIITSYLMKSENLEYLCKIIKDIFKRGKNVPNDR